MTMHSVLTWLLGHSELDILGQQARRIAALAAELDRTRTAAVRRQADQAEEIRSLKSTVSAALRLHSEAACQAAETSNERDHWRARWLAECEKCDQAQKEGDLLALALQGAERQFKSLGDDVAKLTAALRAMELKGAA